MMITVVVSLRLFMALYCVITSFPYCNEKGCILSLSVRPYYSLFVCRTQYFFENAVGIDAEMVIESRVFRLPSAVRAVFSDTSIPGAVRL